MKKPPDGLKNADLNKYQKKGNTSMKLKKINRGLVLGAVLIASTAAYVVYDNSQFEGSKQEIENKIRSYLSDTAQVNLSGADNIYSKAEELINNYWTYDKSADENYTGKNSIISDIQAYKDDNDISGYITECEFSPSDIKVTKNGPDGALVTMQIELYEEFYGMPAGMTPSGFEQIDNENYDENGNNNESDKIKYKNNVVFDTVTFELVKKDNDWKIVSSECYGWDGSAVIIEDDTSSEGGESNGE